MNLGHKFKLKINWKKVLIGLLFAALLAGISVGLYRYNADRAVGEWMKYIDDVQAGYAQTYETMMEIGYSANSFSSSIFSKQANLMYYMLRDADTINSARLQEVRTNLQLEAAYLLDENYRIIAGDAEDGMRIRQAQIDELTEEYSRPDHYVWAIDVGNDKSIIAEMRRLKDGRFLLAGFDADKQVQTTSLLSWLNMGQTVNQSSDEFDIVAYTGEDTEPQVVFFIEAQEEVKKIEDFGAAGIEFKDGWHGTFTYAGEMYYAACKTLPDDGMMMVHACSSAQVLADTRYYVALMTIAVAIIACLIVLYAHWLKRAEQVGKPKHRRPRIRNGLALDTQIFKHLQVVLVIGLILIFILSVYLQAMLDVPDGIIENQENISKLENNYSMIIGARDEMTHKVSDIFIGKAHALEYILRSKTERCTRDDLEELSKMIGVESIMLFDARGVLDVTNSQYSGLTISSFNADDPSYVYSNLLKGGEDVIGKPLMGKEDDSRQCIGVCMRDADGTPDGALLINVDTGFVKELSEKMNLMSFLQRYPISDEKMLIAINTETGIIEYCSAYNIEGLDYETLGLTEQNMSGNFSGILQFALQDFIAASTRIEDLTLFILSSNTLTGNLKLGLVLTVQMGIYLLALCIVCSLTHWGEEEEETSEPVREVNTDRDTFVITGKRVDLFQILCDSVAMKKRGRRRLVRFLDHPPSRRVESAAKLMFVLYVVIAYLTYELFRCDYAIALSILPMYGVNIVSISYCIVATTFIMVLAIILRALLKMFANNLEARAATVCRMLRSCVNYLAFTISIFICLSRLGVDTASMMTSVGIMTAVVGFGSQKLIADFIGGLFIIFEGNIRVGDIINTNSTYGVVKEIGLRTMQIVTRDNNIAIINNSAITSVTNLSSYGSSCMVDIPIADTVDLDELEPILRRELKQVEREKRIPTVTWGPIYLGVSAFDGNKVNLSFVAGCDERYKNETQRRMNRMLKGLLDKNGIRRV